MRITYFGPGDLFDTPFYNQWGEFDLDPISATPTAITVRNHATGAVTTFQGSGFPSLNQLENEQLFGTVTGWTVTVNGNRTHSTVTGINWPLDQFLGAMLALEDDEEGPILALFNRQDITLDASQSVSPLWDFGFEGVTRSVTVISSAYGDEISGGNGNDILDIRGSSLGYGTEIFGSLGSDRITFENYEIGGWVNLSYSDMDTPSPINVVINGIANTGTVTGTWGTDTLVDIRKLLLDDSAGGGFTLIGSRSGDTFTINGGQGTWMAIDGGPGQDAYNLTLTGSIRLIFRALDTDIRPTSGVVVDVAAGLIRNDGYGNTEQLNITDGPGRLQIQGSDMGDRITGSARNEVFFASAGNDTIDGGDGWDVMRYDRNQITTAVQVNLGTGTATGTWNFGQGWGSYSFTDQLRNIDEVRGTAYGDYLSAAGLNRGVRLDARNGNDTIQGGNGDDTLLGGAGNDLIYTGNAFDTNWVDPGQGMDVVNFTGVTEGFTLIAHQSLRNYAVTARITSGGTSVIEKFIEEETRLLQVENALRAGGLGILGSNQGDRFDVTLTDSREYLELFGGAGNNSFELDGTGGTVRLQFGMDGYGGLATSGLRLNLATGTVGNNGFGGQDTITHSGNVQIQINGTDHGDAIIGSAGRDIFLATAGNDTVDGGAGRDLMRYDRGMMSSGVRVDLTAGTARGAWSGQAFTDRLSNIEDLRGTAHNDVLYGSAGVANTLDGRGGNDVIAGDGFYAWHSMDAAKQVYRLFEAMLARKPGAEGQLTWVKLLDDGSSQLIDVANGFINSAEFQSKYGGLDNAAFVTQLFVNVLGRPPAPAGLQTWVNQLENGATRAQVVLGLSEAPEFKTKTDVAAAAFTNDRDPASWSDEVYRLFKGVLDRDPVASGMASWSKALAGGTSLISAITGFVNGPEFQAKYGALDNAGFVNQLFVNILGRPPAPAGMTSWMDRMDGGMTRSEVVFSLVQSQEYISATNPALKAWMRAQGVDDTLIAGSGSNDLYGGAMADAFVFRAGDSGSHRVHDFEAWDWLQLEGFGFASGAQALAQFSQSGNDVVFNHQGTAITLLGTQLAELDANTFLL